MMEYNKYLKHKTVCHAAKFKSKLLLEFLNVKCIVKYIYLYNYVHKIFVKFTSCIYTFIHTCMYIFPLIFNSIKT